MSGPVWFLFHRVKCKRARGREIYVAVGARRLAIARPKFRLSDYTNSGKTFFFFSGGVTTPLGVHLTCYLEHCCPSETSLKRSQNENGQSISE